MSERTYVISPGWHHLLAARSINVQAIARQAGLPESLDTNTRLSGTQFYGFCWALQDQLDDPGVVVDVVASLQVEHFDATVFAALCSRDLHAASHRLSRFKPLLAPCELEVADGENLVLRYRFDCDHERGVPSILLEFDALFMTQLARLGTRTAIAPLHITMPRPPMARQPFETFAGCCVRSGDDLEVAFARDAAKHPFLTSNAAMWDIFQPHLRQRLADLAQTATTADRLRSVLIEALPAGTSEVALVARRLGVSPRTLQRRLASEDTTYQRVLRQTREALAHDYLSATSLTTAEISYLLGFEQPASFYRAFQDWTGTTPLTVRRQTSRPS